MIPVPDLLSPEPRFALDGEALNEMLELAYVGGDTGMSLERALSHPSVQGSTWNSPKPRYQHSWVSSPPRAAVSVNISPWI